MAVYTEDLRGEICPYPLVVARQKASELSAGDTLELLVDYPLAVDNVTRWAEGAGFEVSVEKLGVSEWKLVIRL